MFTKRLDRRPFAAHVIARLFACQGREVMKVLTRIDDSKSSKNLVRALVIQFRTENAEILARHVLAPVDPVAPPEVAYSFWLVLSSSLMLPLAELRSLISLAGLDGAMRPTFASIFENNFPNLSYGVTLDLPIRNRTTQADAARALLEPRRFQVRMQDVRNQTVWDVNKAMSAVTQARDSLDATLKLVGLAHQVLELQQNKKCSRNSCRPRGRCSAWRPRGKRLSTASTMILNSPDRRRRRPA
jgi:hypothetical protein